MAATVLNNWKVLSKFWVHLEPIFYDYLYAIIGALVFAYSVYLIYRPVNRIRDLTDVGFWYLKDTGKKASVKRLANEVLKHRKVGEIPPVYPNGWFVVAESRDLKLKQVKPVSVLGQNLVIFRSESGSVHVLDTYCPHLGANLGVGSRVIGDCIECPFHGWQFEGNEGKCTKIPYSTQQIPKSAQVKSWTSREMNGYIYIWYHAEGEDPYWEPIEMKEITTGSWIYRGRSEHYVKAHIQEIPENGSDVVHLDQLHRGCFLAGSDIRSNFSRFWNFAIHTWKASWEAGKGQDSHIAEMSVEHSINVHVLFQKLKLASVNARVQQIGPAIVYLHFQTPFGKAILMHNVTPIEPLKQMVTHALYCAPSVPVLYSKLIIIAEAIMLERDIMIWNHKMFLQKPLLVSEDLFIGKMRRWYSQFYSENSPKLHIRKDTLDW